MPIIFYSGEDVAGKNIARALVEKHGFTKSECAAAEEQGFVFRIWKSAGGMELVELGTRTVEADYLSEFFQSDLFVFASRHSSETGKPCLTAHATGNWGGKAEVGGKPRELCLTSARALKSAVKFLEANKIAGFEVFLEVTHHGPTELRSPAIFVEVGSSEAEWNNEAAVRVVAEAVLHVCRNYGKEKGRVAIGFGGGHYAPSFTKTLKETDFLVSHIAAKYALDELNEKMVSQAVEKTSEKVDLALIDWKGCSGEQRKRVISILKSIGLEYEKA
jgi:D-aminoacyl-tRNA deacylase